MDEDITALYCCLDDFCKVFDDWEAHGLIPSPTTRQQSAASLPFRQPDAAAVRAVDGPAAQPQRRADRRLLNQARRLPQSSHQPPQGLRWPGRTRQDQYGQGWPKVPAA
jgi:hypothetical protein